MTNDDVNHHLDGAFAPTNPAHQNTVAALFTSRGAHDLLPMMQLTDADRAANAARWDREHDAPPVPVIDGVDECWGDHDGCCR